MQAEDRASKLKQMLVKTKKELSDAKKVVNDSLHKRTGYTCSILSFSYELQEELI